MMRLHILLTLALTQPSCSESPGSGTSSVQVEAGGAVAADDSMPSSDNPPAELGEEHRDSQSLLHPGYPQLPLARASEYKYGTPINLDFPGLQLGAWLGEV